MQVFGDLAELWEIPFDGAKVMCTRQDEPPEQWKDSSWFHPGRQLSVMMLDCERLDWDIDEIVGGLDEGRYDYEQLMFELCIVDARARSTTTSRRSGTTSSTTSRRDEAPPLHGRSHAAVEERQEPAEGRCGSRSSRRRAPPAWCTRRRRCGSPAAGTSSRRWRCLARRRSRRRCRSPPHSCGRAMGMAEQRIGFFRNPRVMKLRARVGL